MVLLMHHRREAHYLPVHLAAGMALLYGLGMTLFLPAAEWQMSYERQFVPLRTVLPSSENVVLSRGLGEPQRAMLHYYTGLKTLRLENKENRQTQAAWLLTERLAPPLATR